MRITICKAAAVLVWLLCSAPIYAADWQSCSSDFATLKRAVNSASNAADRAKNAADDLERCRKNPQIFDQLRDQCHSKTSDYNAALREFDSERSSIDHRVRVVSYSCADITTSVASQQTQRGGSSITPMNSFCDLYRSYKGQVPDEILWAQCSKKLGKAGCDKCLN